MSGDALLTMPRTAFRSRVAAVVEEHRRKLDAIVARGEGPALLGILRSAEGDLRRRLLRAYARGLEDRWTAVHFDTTRTMVIGAIRHVELGMRGLLGADTRRLAEVGMHSVANVLRIQEARFASVVAPLQLDQALRFDHTLRGVLSSRLRQYDASVVRYGTRMISEMEKIFSVGVINKLSLGQMVDELAGKSGLFQERRYMAARIVRTELLASYNHGAQAAIVEELEDFPDLQRMILAHHDRRTASDSIYVDGEVRGVKDDFVDGAGRHYLVPPARPNDREHLIPWRKAWGNLF